MHSENKNHQIERESVLPMAFIVAIPIVMMAINSNWVFTSLGWLDPWYYVGYGYHYLDPTYENHYYKISRLPWILVQFVFRQSLEPVFASYAIQLTCMALGAISVFITCRLLRLGDVAAFLASAFLLTYGWYLGPGSGSADYHNTLAAPLYALTALFMTWAGLSTARPPWIPLVAAGAAYGLTVHSNIFYLNFLPVLFIQFIAAQPSRRPTFGSLVSCGVGLVGGAVAVTAILGLIHASVGRGFRFYKPMFGTSWQFAVDNSKIAQWWKPWHTGWFWDAGWMPLLVAGAIFAAIGFYVAPRHPNHDVRHVLKAIFGQYLFLFGLWMFWQSVGKTTLDYSYFAHPLIIPLAMVIGGVITLCSPTSRLTWIVLLVTLCGFVGSLAAGTYLQAAIRHYIAASVFTVTLAAALCAGVAITLAKRWKIGLVLFVCLMAVSKEFSNSSALAYSAGSCLQWQKSFKAVVQANLLLTSRVKGDQIYIWFDDKNPEFIAPDSSCPSERTVRSFGMSLASTGLKYLDQPWSGMREIRAIDDANIQRALKRNAYIGLITERTENVDQLAQRAHALSIEVRRAEPFVVEVAPYRITIHVVEPVS